MNSPVGEGAPASRNEDADGDQDHEGDSREESMIPDSFFVLCERNVHGICCLSGTRRRSHLQTLPGGEKVRMKKNRDSARGGRGRDGN